MPSFQARILLITSEAVLIPQSVRGAEYYTAAPNGGFPDSIGRLIADLLDLGVDVHVAQPDYRRVFKNVSRTMESGIAVKIPTDRVHLTEDRAFFYSDYPDSNHQWQNINISLAFQREVINHIIPEIYPDLLHCHDWMSGLIPAMAKKLKIPCLFTVQNPVSAKSFLSDIEDRGIDAAVFWQNLSTIGIPSITKKPEKLIP